MNKSNSKDLDINNGERLKEMILKFTQCADAASDLSASVEKFTALYSEIGKNITELKEIDKSLSTNEYFQDMPNQLGMVAEKIKSMLSESNIYSKAIVDDFEKAVNKNNKARKKELLDTKAMLDTKAEAFKNEMLDAVKDIVERSINEKLQAKIGDFYDITDNEAPSVNNDSDLETIYNLYIKGFRSLPIYVVKNNWYNNFYFKVESINAYTNDNRLFLTAFGTRYRDNEYYDAFQYTADSCEFRLYPKAVVEFVPIDDGDIPF
jgi:hypothetical protein